MDQVESLIDAWVDAQESQHTQVAYRRDIASDAPRMKVAGWIPWCTRRDIDPLAARRRDVDAYKQALKQAVYSPTSIARRLAVISSWYDYLLDEEVVEDNPAKSVKRPRVDRTVSNAVGVTEEELNRILDIASEESVRSLALVTILFYGGGLRVGSICNAQVGDLRWNEGHRTIRLVVKGGEVVYEPLVDIVTEALDAYLAERKNATKHEPLFVRANGAPVDQPYVWREVRRLAKAAGVPAWEHLSPHSLRHSVTTHLLDHGIPITDVQDIMRHRSLDTTRRYDRARGKRDRQPMKVLAERRRRYLAERDAEPLPQDRSET